MSEPNTSATYDAWSLLERLLASIAFPAAPVASAKVGTWCGDPQGENDKQTPCRERVVVVSVAMTPDQEWGAGVGQLSRDEEFRVPLYVETNLAGRTTTQVRARLRQLTKAVEDRIREVNFNRNGEVDPPAEMAGYPVWQFAVRSVAPQVQPGQEGAIGMAALVVQFKVRVGTPPVET